MVCAFKSSESVVSSPLLSSLYSDEQVSLIRDVVRDILVGLSVQSATSMLNERLKKKREEGVSFSPSSLSRLKNFGLSADASGLELLYRLPFLYLISDRYSYSQMRSVALGQDPLVDPMAIQLRKNEYFLGFKDLQNIFVDAPQRVDFYRGRRGFSDLYSDYQVYRIRKVANFIVNIENERIAKSTLAAKVTLCYPQLPCRDTNIANLLNIGSNNTNSSINVLAHLPSLSCLSDRFSFEDLRLVAQGQTPPCMEEEEFAELRQWRDRLRQVVNKTSKLELPSLFSCTAPQIALPEYLRSQFRELNLNWEDGIRQLLSFCPSQERQDLRKVDDVLRGRNKTPDEETIHLVKWVLFCLLDQEFTVADIERMLF